MASPGVDQGALLLRRQLTGMFRYSCGYKLFIPLLKAFVNGLSRVYSNNFILYSLCRASKESRGRIFGRPSRRRGYLQMGGTHYWAPRHVLVSFRMYVML